MHLTILHYLFLIPVGLALAFMFWVLWSFTQHLGHRKESTDKQPMISIRVSDRYSLGTQMQRTPRPETASRLARVSDSESRLGSSASRKYSRTQSVPTLGMGFRRMSSSTIPGARS
jgi:hypothetical protein